MDRWRLALGVTLLFLVGLSLWPVWAGDFLPLHDGAQIEHQASILYDWNVRSSFRAAFERLPYPTPNALGPYLITLFAPLVGVHLGFKVVLTLALLAVPLSAYALVRAAHHSAWLLLAVVPWMWHQDVWIGHLGQILGLPMLLTLLAVHLSFARDPGPWRAVLQVVMLALLATTDLLLWFTGAALLTVLGASVGWRWRRWWGAPLLAVRELALALPSMALLVPWVRAEWLGRGGFGGEWTLPMDTVKLLFSRLFDVFGPRGTALDSLADLLFNRPGDPISALWLLGIGLWTLAAVRQGREGFGATGRPMPAAAPYANLPIQTANAAVATPPAQLLRNRPWSGTAYLGWAFAWVAAGLLLLPTNILKPVWIHGFAPRLVTVLALLGALALPLRPDWPPMTARWRTWAGTAALLVAAAWMALSALRSTVLTQQEFSHLRAAMATVPPDKSLLVLRSNDQSRWMQPAIFHHVGQWWGALGGGAVPFSFRDPALQPVRPRPGRLLPSPPADSHDQFNWNDHGRFYDFIAVYREPFAPEIRAEAMLRSWPRLYHRGRWQVFQNLRTERWPPPPALAPPANADEAVTDALLGLWAPWMGWQFWQAEAPTDELAGRRENLIRHLLNWPVREVQGLAPEAMPQAVPAQRELEDSLASPRLRGGLLQQRPEMLAPLRFRPLNLPRRATPDMLP